MRFQSYFNTVIRIISLYDGTIPLHHFLKQYFSQHNKHGSKDRKIITHVCYNFYRLGKSFSDKSIEEKLKLAIFLCNDEAGEWDFLYDDEWLNNWNASLHLRIAFIKTKYDFFLTDVFPFADELSESLDTGAFIQSFFFQPDVFIRIRPGYYKDVINKLEQHQIRFNIADENCIALPAATNINSIIKVDEEVVIQDYSTQKIKIFIDIIKPEIRNLKSEIKTWDCCAGSGGKSILAYDVFENINLTVSDIRASIIQNLKDRFSKAGIKKYKSFVLDITQPLAEALLLGSGEGFDLIICDAPCTGSGTWSRTPEQLYFFEIEKIDEYALLQKKIVTNANRPLKQGGYFLYITCSVFKKENEEIADFIKKQFHLDLVKMELLKGYDNKADTMFAALFKKLL